MDMKNWLKKVLAKECLTSPKRMNFRKSSKQPLIPPHFRKVILQIFSTRYEAHGQKAPFQGPNFAT